MTPQPGVPAVANRLQAVTLVSGIVVVVAIAVAGVYFLRSGDSPTPEITAAEKKSDDIATSMRAAQPQPTPTSSPADFERKVPRGAAPTSPRR